jgi:hypothetical protein
VVNSSKILLRLLSGDVEHQIVTKDPPLLCRFHLLDSEKLAAAKKEFLQISSAVPTALGPLLYTW